MTSLPVVLPASDKLPEETSEGLRLVEDSELRVVYARPGASLQPYKRLALLDCYVEFREDWQRDYNNSVRGAGRKLKTEDMEAIKQKLAEEFRMVFTKELETEGGYEIVTEAAEDVLVLRPAIINLDVAAPDVKAPGMHKTVVSSAGSMTLYLELYDSVSNQLLAKVLDPRIAPRRGGATMGNSVNNKAEADRIMRRWADVLRDHLDAARGPAIADK